MARSTTSKPNRAQNSRKQVAAVPGRAGLSQRQLELAPIGDLAPDPRNPRTHDRVQVRAIAKSIEAFGFNAPILIDKNRKIIAGHGRYEAAIYLGLAQVPVIRLEHLTEGQARAYMLADNKLTDRSTWDDGKLAVHLKELSELAGDFDIEAIGFELPEMDFRIQSLDAPEVADDADQFEEAEGEGVSVAGDLWLLGEHRLYCGSALDAGAYAKRGDIVLDPFVGSGTVFIAAERTGRRGYGIEIDGRYVDTAIERWERFTGRKAQTAQGRTFAQMKLERGGEQ